MKKIIKIIVTIGLMIMYICLFGSMEVSAAEPTPESVIDMAQVVDYVAYDGNLQLYFCDGTGYYWENEGSAVSAVVLKEYVSDGYTQSDNNYIDMNTVIDFDVTEYGFQLYLIDGTGYYWER